MLCEVWRHGLVLFECVRECDIKRFIFVVVLTRAADRSRATSAAATPAVACCRTPAAAASRRTASGRRSRATPAGSCMQREASRGTTHMQATRQRGFPLQSSRRRQRCQWKMRHSRSTPRRLHPTSTWNGEITDADYETLQSGCGGCGCGGCLRWWWWLSAVVVVAVCGGGCSGAVATVASGGGDQSGFRHQQTHAPARLGCAVTGGAAVAGCMPSTTARSDATSASAP